MSTRRPDGLPHVGEHVVDLDMPIDEAWDRVHRTVEGSAPTLASATDPEPDAGTPEI